MSAYASYRSVAVIPLSAHLAIGEPPANVSNAPIAGAPDP